MPRDRAPPLFPHFDVARDGGFPEAPVTERGAVPAEETSSVPAGDPGLSRSDAQPDSLHAVPSEPPRETNRRAKRTASSNWPARTIAQLISELAPRHGSWQVFSDFCEMAALAFSNAIDRAQFETREARYLEAIKRYRPDELARFPEMLALLTESLEAETTDVLGRTFHELELHNKWAGQFFTPFPICQMMAKMLLSDEADIRGKIETRGFITAQEPAVGSGAMVIALALALQEMGINYQKHLHVTAIDVDAKCVHMAYAQFALLHIPATVVHGNALTLEEWAHWHTPAHILGGWRFRLACDARPQGGEPEAAGRDAASPTSAEAIGPGQLNLF